MCTEMQRKFAFLVVGPNNIGEVFFFRSGKIEELM